MAKSKAKVGRPTDYRPEYAEQARKLFLLGLTDAEVAKFFDTSVQTMQNWRSQFPEFLAANDGKVPADGEVAKKLYERALGYSHPAVKIVVVNGEVKEIPYTEHYPPDTTAAIKWLHNRQPKRWRDKQVEADPLTPGDIAKAIREEMAKVDG